MKKYTQEELKEILEKHKLWLEDQTKGEKANLRGAILSRADLRGADLREAYLGGANLFETNLREANLSGADLSRADLFEANLRGADLSRADLHEAILSRADLNGANLHEAILNRAYLNGANLSGAYLSHTIVNSFTLGKHFGYSWKNKKGKIIVKIGCEEHEIDYWKKHIVEIGNKHGYSDKEINKHKRMIALLILNEKDN
jgi:hypothetical protein